MPKLQTVTTNFTGGEFSPRLRGRVDLERYNASAELLRNVVVLRQGGAAARPSLDFKGAVKNHAHTARLIPFIYSRDDAYVLELGDHYMRVWKGGALVEASPGVPYEIATPWGDHQVGELDFTQGADTLIVVHGDVAPQRIQRFANAAWRCSTIPFQPPALYENGTRAALTMTISSGTVGTGRTLTAGSSFFLASDLGRVISWGTGSATITAIGSGTSATATVTDAFASNSAPASTWVLEASPLAGLTPSEDGPVGASLTLTLDNDGWRASDVGRFIDVNGGLVEITAVGSATVANGFIRRALTSNTAAPADSWFIRGSVWNDHDGYPQTCTLFQQRLWFGGSEKFPQSKWGSMTGLYFDFTPGTDDDSAVYKTFDSDDINVLQYLVSASDLLGLTYGSEFECRGGVEKPITQLNDQIKKLSRWGCASVRPEEAGEDVLFVQRGGRALRALRKNEVDVRKALDISVFSEHLFADGVRSMSYEQTPEQVVWIATGAGQLLAFTYSAEQNTSCFCSGDASGFVEWLTTIPDGDIDATYALVRRTVNGQTRRYVERLNWGVYPGMDSRRQVTLGAPATTVTGFAHLAGESVAVLADGIYAGMMTVSPAGEIELPREAMTVAAGLPYTPLIRLQAPEVGTGSGTSQGQQKSTHQVLVRLKDTTGCTVNGQELPFREFGDGILDQPPPIFTGIKDVTDYGWDKDSPLEISQPQPYPLTVLGVVRNFTVNAS